jgi:hypothetical protein
MQQKMKHGQRVLLERKKKQKEESKEQEVGIQTQYFPLRGSGACAAIIFLFLLHKPILAMDYESSILLLDTVPMCTVYAI